MNKIVNKQNKTLHFMQDNLSIVFEYETDILNFV